MYRSLKKDQIYTGEITEKKSRFLSYLAFAGSEEEALSFIDSIRKKHHDARHNCSAYVIAGTAGDTVHSSDDGEPSGTAGKPMLTVLQGNDLQIQNFPLFLFQSPDTKSDIFERFLLNHSL